MKKIYLYLLLLLLASGAYTQTLFTDTYVGEIPFPLKTIDNYLYVGTFLTAEVTRIDLNSATPTPELVATVPNEILNMDYHPASNRIFLRVAGVPFIYEVNLDDPFPIIATQYVQVPLGATMLTVDGDTLYISESNSTEGVLHSIDLNIGPSSLGIVRTVPVEMDEIEVHNNELYYVGRLDPSDPVADRLIIKFDLSSSSSPLVTVAEPLDNFALDLHVVGEQLYIGLDVVDKIYRVDLNSTFPATPQLVVEGFGAGTYSISDWNNTFYATINDQTIITFDDTTLGTEDINSYQSIIYPNPASDKLFIETSIDTPLDYAIFNIQGQKVLSLIYSEEGIDISNLTTGMYFLKIQSDKSEQTLKFVKK